MIISTKDTAFVTAAASRELEDWGTLPDSMAAPMRTSGVIIWKDGEQEAGVWECTPGLSRWSLATNEFVYVLFGRMTVTRDGGGPSDLGPGETMVFPLGWTGSWEIHEPLRKLYVKF